MGKFVDLTGKVYGHLTVIEKDHSNKNGWYWKCQCDCGNITVVDRHNLANGSIKSCGCSRPGITRKSKRKASRLYQIWIDMRRRCYNPNLYAYKYYGALGVTVCDEWQNSFTSFRDWALKNGYSESLTIDRIDCFGNYEPSNCRWSDWSTQRRNQRRCYKNEQHI